MFSFIKQRNFTVILNKVDEFIQLIITNVSKEHTLTSKHWNNYNEEHARQPAYISLSLPCHFDGISPTQSAISSSLREKKIK